VSRRCKNTGNGASVEKLGKGDLRVLNMRSLLRGEGGRGAIATRTGNLSRPGSTSIPLTSGTQTKAKARSQSGESRLFLKVERNGISTKACNAFFLGGAKIAAMKRELSTP